MRLANVVRNFREESLWWCVKHYCWRAWRILTHDGWQQLYGLYLFGHRVAVPLNARVGGTQYMKIGTHCGFGTHVWLECIDRYGTGEEEQHFQPELIIGTHSTVTHDVPPNSIAVGSPARVIKQWDDQQHAWVRVPRIGR